MSDTAYGYHDYSIPDPPHQPLYLKQMLKFLGTPKTVLDAGCGDGNFSESLAQGGHTLYGIDLSEGGIAKAKQRNCGIFAVCSVYDDFGNVFQQEFDAVVSVEVIEHLYDPRDFTRQIYDASDLAASQ